MEKCYSRLLIDNHITDILPEFMSRIEPEQYVEMLKLAGVESSMVYCDHTGTVIIRRKADTCTAISTDAISSEKP